MQIQHSAPTRRRWERRRIGASIWIFSHGRRLHLGSAFYGFPRAPWSSFCHSPTMPPCWEGFSFGKPTHGHPVWTDCTARSPETSSADLEATYYTEPPTGSAASRLRLRLIQPQRLTRVSRQRPRIRSLRDKEPSDQGEPGHVAVLMDPPHRCLVSPTPPSRLRDVLVERLDLNSGGLLTGTRWPGFQPTIAGVGKKTWTFTWEPILGSITGRSQPPSGLN